VVEYTTEEEQLEALKKWWERNGRSLIAGVILGLSALLGWYVWTSYQQRIAEEASSYFHELKELVTRFDSEQYDESVAILQRDYSSTPYAGLASLELAKRKAEDGNLQAAQDALHWALEHTDHQPVVDIARLRLARVLVAQDKAQDALNILDEGSPEGYTSLSEEIRGDAMVKLGDISQARAAYQQAIDTASGNVEFIQMKLDDLGEPAPDTGTES